MAVIRTFIAVPLEKALYSGVRDVQARLRKLGGSVSWVSSANLHLTLRFIGSLEERELPELVRIVERRVAKEGCFEFTVQGLGVFPDIHSPKVIWLGVDKGSVSLLGKLKCAIDSSLSEIGYPLSLEKFVPHITIGRVRREGGELFSAINDYVEPGRMKVGHVALMRSDTGVSVYSKVTLFHLGA